MAATAPSEDYCPPAAPPPLPGGIDDLKAEVFIFLPWEALGPPSVRPSGAQRPLRPMTLTKLAFYNDFFNFSESRKCMCGNSAKTDLREFGAKFSPALLSIYPCFPVANLVARCHLRL